MNRTALLDRFARAADAHDAHLAALAAALPSLAVQHPIAAEPVPDLAPPLVEPAPGAEWRFDPAIERWVDDHRPTWTGAVMPGAWMFDRLAAIASQGRRVAALEDAQLFGWLRADEPFRARVDVEHLDHRRVAATLSVFRRSARTGLSRFDPRARAIVVLAPTPAPTLPPLEPLHDPEPLPDPYDNCFLGPGFRVATRVILGANGATSFIDLTRSSVPPGLLHVGLLDASLHAGLPRARLRWYPDLDSIALPSALVRLDLLGPVPADPTSIRVELRNRGATADGRFAYAHVRYFEGDRLFMALDSRQVLFASRVPPHLSERFMRDRLPSPGAMMARVGPQDTRFSLPELLRLDWLPGTLATVYGLPPGLDQDACVAHIALKDHGARAFAVHPSAVVVAADLRRVSYGDRHLVVHFVRADGEVIVSDAR